jgi:hypothetical protein
VPGIGIMGALSLPEVETLDGGGLEDVIRRTEVTLHGGHHGIGRHLICGVRHDDGIVVHIHHTGSVAHLLYDLMNAPRREHTRTNIKDLTSTTISNRVPDATSRERPVRPAEPDREGSTEGGRRRSRHPPSAGSVDDGRNRAVHGDRYPVRSDYVAHRVHPPCVHRLHLVAGTRSGRDDAVCATCSPIRFGCASGLICASLC